MKKLVSISLSLLISFVFIPAIFAISWQTDLVRGFEKAKSEAKPVMADFYTDWCGWCKKLDKDVYEDSGIDNLSEKFICVKVNCTKDREAPGKYGVRGYPTIIFFDAEGKMIETIVGYRPAPAFAETMKEVLDKTRSPGTNRQVVVDSPQIRNIPLRGEPDVISLKNGGNLSGVIVKEDARAVELSVGGGSVVINRSEIKTIHRAGPEALAQFKDSLEDRQDDLLSKEKALSDERDKRLKDYENWSKQEALRKNNKRRSEGEVGIMRAPGSNAVLVETVLNGDVKAVLTLDTGADIVVLSKRIGEALGIDMSSDPGKDVKELRLAGGKTAKARMIVLKTVDIQGVEEKDVLAAVLLEDSGSDFKDGLLGRSFLGRFNINIDLEKMRMSLKKLQ